MHAFYSSFFRKKAQSPARIEPFSEPEKAKSVPGFDPGLLGQNATALLLAPRPQPIPLSLLEILRNFKIIKIESIDKIDHYNG